MQKGVLRHFPVPESLIKKETLAEVFCCEFCKISKNIFFKEHLWRTASKLGDHLQEKSFAAPLTVSETWTRKYFYCSYNTECIFDGSKDIPITIKKICKSKDINSKSKLCKICFFLQLL